MSSNREYPDGPVIGVGVIVFRDEDVLLIRRGKPPNKGSLSLPGGGQDLGETVREAAAREVMEETGLEVEVTHLVDVVDVIRGDTAGRTKYHYTLVDFAAEWRSGDPVAGSDAEEAIWVPIAEVGSLNLWSETERVIRKAAALRVLPLDHPSD
ncbi:NUDIX hydrolase [Hwanghaeella sp.]|uniref:NUDIX hydrolase n=1 Tax=Hwanghaeella sp. TaxID=2605943 RepID=UPI003CCC149B